MEPGSTGTRAPIRVGSSLPFPAMTIPQQIEAKAPLRTIMLSPWERLEPCGLISVGRHHGARRIPPCAIRPQLTRDGPAPAVCDLALAITSNPSNHSCGYPASSIPPSLRLLSPVVYETGLSSRQGKGAPGNHSSPLAKKRWILSCPEPG